MYKVSLINLSNDARSVAPQAIVELRDPAPEKLRGLLQDYCALDPVENAASDTEIRVQVRNENYLIRTEQRKLILYDVHHRELPARILSLEEALRELDGTAAASRQQASLQSREAAERSFNSSAVLSGTARPEVRPRLVVGLIFTAGFLLAGIIWLHSPLTVSGFPANFTPIESNELNRVHDQLIGLYLSGVEPGQHGIAIMSPGYMKLFELAAVDAPRVVYADYRLGRVGGRLCLATNQPGGVIEVLEEGHLLYGGETYRRIP